MSSDVPWSALFLDPECSVQYPYLSKDRESWTDCKRQQAYVTCTTILVLSVLIFAALWYFQKDREVLKRALIGLSVFNLLCWIVIPWYKGRMAQAEYDQFEQELIQFKRSNPQSSLSDYLNLKFNERQARASSDIAGAQQLMAGAFAIDAMSDLFHR